jgi:DUF1680 family protein
LASIGQYFYSTGVNSAWVHLYAQGTVNLQVAGCDLRLRQVTNYPWTGAVKIEIGLDHPQNFSLHLRVPGWCEGWQLRINGAHQASLQPQKNGYIAIERTWLDGDILEYEMDMRVQMIWAHPAVRDLQGRVAIQRGPIVYCLEGVDQVAPFVDRVALDVKQIKAHGFEVEFVDNLLGGICVLRTKGTLIAENGWDELLYRSEPPSAESVDIMAVPYYAWANRDSGAMRVWLPVA